jgi:hypothetical protein
MGVNHKARSNSASAWPNFLSILSIFSKFDVQFISCVREMICFCHLTASRLSLFICLTLPSFFMDIFFTDGTGLLFTLILYFSCIGANRTIHQNHPFHSFFPFYLFSPMKRKKELNFQSSIDCVSCPFLYSSILMPSPDLHPTWFPCESLRAAICFPAKSSM